jgi:hypothetical protein
MLLYLLIINLYFLGAVALNSGKFVYWDRYGTPGATSDIKIYQNGSLPAMLLLGHKNAAGERIPEWGLGDKVYEGADQILSPFKGVLHSNEQVLFNSIINQNRVIVENSFARLKNFKLFSVPYRRSLEGLDDTAYCCVNLVNLDLSFRPMR